MTAVPLWLNSDQLHHTLMMGFRASDVTVSPHAMTRIPNTALLLLGVDTGNHLPLATLYLKIVLVLCSLSAGM